MHSPYEKPKKIACHNGIGEKEPLESVRKADLLVAITNLLHPFIFLIGPPNGVLS